MTPAYAIPTATLQELLASWIEAEKAITTGQNYSVEGLSVSRADLATVTARINELVREINARQTAAAGGRVGILTPKWS